MDKSAGSILLVSLIFFAIFQKYPCQNITEPEPKIVGGWLATFERTKHQVSVQVGENHICGGAIISLNKVLTAAHCLYNLYQKPVHLRSPTEFSLVMGTLDLDRLGPKVLIFKVLKYVSHQQFSMDTLANDIAIMFLDGSIPEFHEVAQPIPLTTIQISSDTVCNVNGWGSTYTGGFPQRKLLTTNVTILSTELCKTTYKNLLEGMICAGNWKGGYDACQGDSGGPLSCNDVLVGIVSWGDRCGLPTRPGIYSNVLYYRNWIVANAGSSNYANFFVLSSLLFALLF